MDAGLYIAAQGMLAEQVRQNLISTNLSNSATPGYKAQSAEQKSFDSLLLQNTQNGQSIGSLDLGVDVTKVTTDETAGTLQTTGQPLDFGITGGTGFFAVKTTAGVRYTQDGQFAANKDGDLVDADGDLVLSQSGQPVKVSAKGTVDASQIGLFNVPNATEQGNNLFTGKASGKATGTVRSGVLEESNVDPTMAMTDMIASLRAYQAGQSAIQSIDQTMREDATDVASMPGG